MSLYSKLICYAYKNLSGGGRGIGLALAFACAQAGSNVAILDSLPEPHEDFTQLKDFGVKAKYYKYVQRTKLINVKWIC